MKKLRNICVAALLLLSLGATADALAESRHVVQPGQTLFRIAKKYGVSVDDILKANPGISVTSVPTGVTLIIPDATDVPIVDFPLTVEEEQNMMRHNQEHQMNLPQSPAGSGSSSHDGWQLSSESHWTDGILNLAVIMPFNLEANSPDANKTQMRSVEFYQGVLMAVDEMQESGRRVNVQAYDLGTSSLQGILSNPELQLADFVIAPIEESDVRQVAVWGDLYATPVVSPFGFNVGMISTYSHLFQINTSKSMLYSRLTDELLSRFANYTFIFVKDNMGGSKEDPYPAQLKQSLRVRNIAYHDLNYQSPETLMACDSILNLKEENILFVPVTPQPEAMRRMFSGLQHVKILRDGRYEEALAHGNAPASGQPKMAILGYPEWMLNTDEFMNYYYDLNVYMFTKFYANPFDSKLTKFYSDFKQWYGKEPMQLAPKYALLGYDVAKAFLHALTLHGQNLEQRMPGENVADGLQTPLRFRRNDDGGFFNRAFYLVHFSSDRKVEKIVVE